MQGLEEHLDGQVEPVLTVDALAELHEHQGVDSQGEEPGAVFELGGRHTTDLGDGRPDEFGDTFPGSRLNGGVGSWGRCGGGRHLVVLSGALLIPEASAVVGGVGKVVNQVAGAFESVPPQLETAVPQRGGRSEDLGDVGPALTQAGNHHGFVGELLGDEAAQGGHRPDLEEGGPSLGEAGPDRVREPHRLHQVTAPVAGVDHGRGRHGLDQLRGDPRQAGGGQGQVMDALLQQAGAVGHVG